MSGHRPWSEISEKLRTDPERRARIEQRERAIAEGLNISQMDEVRGATLENVAEPSTRRRLSSPDTMQYE